MVLNTPMKIVLTVVIIFLIGIGFYLLDYQKKLNEIKDLEAQIVNKKDQLRRDEQRVRALPEQLKKREKLQNELNTLIQQKLPKEDAMIFVPKFIQSMEELVALERSLTGDDKLEVLSIAPGQLEKPIDDSGGTVKTSGSGAELKALVMFPKQPFNVQINAKYATTIHFLHQLAALKLQRLVTIDRIVLTPLGQQTYGISPVLSISIPMVAYLNEEKAHAIPGEEDKK
jgi:Tfp pilus assembly protein PilO